MVFSKQLRNTVQNLHCAKFQGRYLKDNNVAELQKRGFRIVAKSQLSEISLATTELLPSTHICFYRGLPKAYNRYL